MNTEPVSLSPLTLKNLISRSGVKDLGLIGFLFFCIAAIWRTLFAWNGKSLIIGQDGVAHHLPTVNQILSGTDPLPFHFGVGGGIALFPVTGIIYLEKLFHDWGFGIFNSINWSILFFQSLTAFFLLKFISVWRKRQLTDYLFSIFLLAFSPILIMRFQAGHVNFILSSVLVPMGLFLASALRKNKPFTVSELMVTTFTLSQLLGYLAHQGIYYTILCLSPILIYILTHRQSVKAFGKSFLKLTGIAAVALVFSFTELKSVLDFWASGEISRNIHDQTAVFSYLAPTWSRWKASLFYGLDTITAEHPAWQLHELSYPFFTLIFAFVATGIQSRLRLKVLMLTLIPATLFFFVSMNTSGLTDFFIHSLPGFGSFRVIQRFMIPVLLLVSCLLILFIRPRNRNGKRDLGFIIILAISAYAIHWNWNIRSILYELITAFVFLLSIRFIRIRPFALVLLTALSLNSAVERKPQFAVDTHHGGIFQNIRGLSRSPIERAEFMPGIQVAINLSMTENIPTLSYYSNPSKNFTQLLSLFTGRDETYTMFFSFISDLAPRFLKVLYNVTTQIQKEGDALIAKEKIKSTSLRFPQIIQKHLPSEILELATSPEKTNHYIQNVLDADIPVSSIPEHCRTLNGNTTKADLSGIEIQIQGNADGCYLVLPLNYSTLYQVTDDQNRKLDTFVSHQTLLGIALNQRSHTIQIKPKRILDSSIMHFEKLLGILLVFLLYLAFRMSQNSIRASEKN